MSRITNARFSTSWSRNWNLRLTGLMLAAGQNAAYRVIHYLLGLTVGDDERTAGRLRGDRQLVACQLAIESETLSRILSNLAHQGPIEVSGRNIKIISAARPRDAC